MSKRLRFFLLASLVPVVILLGMTAIPLYTLVSGEEVTLRTIPVDPTDLFRGDCGDYVSLRYEAEEVPSSLVDKEVRDLLASGEYNLDVYVWLEPQDDIHVPTKVGLEPPDSPLYLKGKLSYMGPTWDRTAEKEEVAFIRFTLDKYFVEDNTGLQLEEASRNGDILAKVKVKNGYAYLTGIEIDE